MQHIYLIGGSVLTFLMLIMIFVGKKYQSFLDGLEGPDFPIKGTYIIGLAWSSVPFMKLKGSRREKMIEQAKLLYDVRYAEYYANIAWAQFLTFVHICLIFGLLMASLFESVLMLVIGVAMAVVFGGYFLKRMEQLLTTRAEECTAELPEIVSTMALLINAGMMLRNAWRVIAESKAGAIYSLMLESCVNMENGMSNIEAINQFGILSNSTEVRKFTSALTQSLERGGGELNDFLGRQSKEMWALKKQIMLQRGEAAASKLLAPTSMLFVAIIIAVMTGALGMLF